MTAPRFAIAALGAVLIAFAAWWGLSEGDSPASDGPPDALVDSAVDADSPFESDGSSNFEGELPAGHVSGMVVERGSSRPISGAEVSVVCGDDSQIATSDLKGRFEFQGLPDGACALTAVERTHRMGGPETGRPIPVTLKAGRGAADIKIPMFRTVSLSGRAVDGLNGVEGVTLTLLYINVAGEGDEFSVGVDAATNADGRFRVHGVLPGRVQLLAEHDDYGLIESEVLRLKAGDRREGIILSMNGVGTVRGQVTDAEGAAVAGAEVEVRPVEGRGRFAAATDADGRFSISGVPAGALVAKAKLFGHRAGDPLAFELPAEEAVDLHLVLVRMGGIGGVVVDPDGQPVARARIAAFTVDGEPLIGADGKATRFGTSPKGTFTSERDFEFPIVLKASHHGFSEGPGVLISGPTLDITLTLGAGGTLVGRVVDGMGQPITIYRAYAVSVGAEGEAHDAANRGNSRSRRGPRRPIAVNDPTGAFRFTSMAPGRYKVEIVASNRPAATSEIALVSVENEADVGVIRVKSGGSIKGQVVDAATGSALRGVTVSYEGGSLHGRRYAAPRAVTDASGSFTLSGIPDELVSLRIRPPKGYIARLLSGIQIREGQVHHAGVIRMTADDSGERRMQYSGVGMSLQRNGGRLMVRNVFEGAPASGMGLGPGTEILEIDGQPVADLNLREAIERIRGEAGSDVSLVVAAPGSDEVKTVEVRRGDVVTP